MSDDQLTPVYASSDVNQAEIIKQALLHEGIRCELDGEHQAGLTGIMQVKVLVHAVDADRARQLIEHHGSE